MYGIYVPNLLLPHNIKMHRFSDGTLGFAGTILKKRFLEYQVKNLIGLFKSNEFQFIYNNYRYPGLNLSII